MRFSRRNIKRVLSVFLVMLMTMTTFSTVTCADEFEVPKGNMQVFVNNTAGGEASWKKTGNAVTGLAKNMIDGRADTSFADTSAGGMVVVDLGNPYRLSGVSLTFGNTNTSQNYNNYFLFYSNYVPSQLNESNITEAIFSAIRAEEVAGVANSEKELLYIGAFNENTGAGLTSNKNVAANKWYRYVVIVNPYRMIDIAEITVRATDGPTAPRKAANIAPKAAKFATSAYANKGGIASLNLIEDNATDGDDNTNFATHHASRGTVADPERFIIDLGWSCPISLIRFVETFNAAWSTNFSIYVANRGDFADRHKLYDAGTTNIKGKNLLLTPNVASPTATGYKRYGEWRYVLVEANVPASNLAVGEIEIYAAEEHLGTSELLEISQGKRVVTTGGYAGTTGEFLTTHLNNERFLSAGSAAGQGAYAYVDLGDEYMIEEVALMTGTHEQGVWTGNKGENFRSGYTIFGLSESELPTGNEGMKIAAFQAASIAKIPDVIAAADADGTTSGLVAFGPQSGSPERNKAYRYVGVVKTPRIDEENPATILSDGQLCLKQLRVYGSKVRYPAAIDLAPAVDHDAGTVSGEIKGIEAAGRTQYTLIAASYNKFRGLIKADMKRVQVNCIADKSYTASYSLNIDPAAKYIQMYVFEDVTSIKPIRACKVIGEMPPVLSQEEIKISRFLESFGKAEIGISYIGGSITEGANAEPQYTKRWSSLLTSMLNNVAPQGVQVKELGSGHATSSMINAGISGTDSAYGLMRLQRDVLSKNPDIIFIEWSVNDASEEYFVASVDETKYHSTAEAPSLTAKTNEGKQLAVKERMDAIIQRIMQTAPDTKVVIVSTTTEAKHRVATLHQEVAAHYGIGWVDLQIPHDNYIANGGQERCSNGNSGTDGFFGKTDGTHPSTLGHELYAKYIFSQIGANPSAMVCNPNGSRMYPESGNVFIPAYISAADMVKTGTWTVEKEAQCSSDTDAVISADFTGNAVALIHRIGIAGKMEITVTNKDTAGVVIRGELEPSTSGTTPNAAGFGKCYFENFDLPYGNYTITIKPISGTIALDGIWYGGEQ